MDQMVHQLKQPVPKGTDTLGYDWKGLLCRGKSFLERTERKGIGKEKDEVGRRVRFGLC